ncbi:MAG: RecX family transcriptional regulator [Marinifilaceae bacterium]|jgi:regulatory protein|nr:RecX family transcriptional regulator [Marinifilaceae bacterium]
MKYISYEKALSKAAEICSKSEKCSNDIIKKLNSWGLEKDYHEKVIDYLIDNNFIDHERYTNAFCNDKFKYNKWGKQKIKFQLKSKFIESQYIDKALAKIDQTEYYNMAKELIQYKLNNIKYDDKYQAKNKLLSFGASRGFEADILFNIIDDLLADFK